MNVWDLTSYASFRKLNCNMKSLMQIKIKVCALLVSLNVANEFTPQYNQMGNDHFPLKEYQVWIRASAGVCWQKSKERRTCIIQCCSHS